MILSICKLILCTAVLSLRMVHGIPIVKHEHTVDQGLKYAKPADHLTQNSVDDQQNNVIRQESHDVMLYIQKYGYLTREQARNKDDVNDAIGSLRNVFGLEPNNKIDDQLLKHIRAPRCGNPDIEPVHKKKRQKRFVQISKWANKMDEKDTLRLKWFIERYTADIPKLRLREIVQRAFKIWSDQSSMPLLRTVKLEFNEAPESSESDIGIMWAEQNHGDAYPFDGPGDGSNVLAHTFYPNYQQTGTLNGDIHLDDYEHWVVDEKVPVHQGIYFPYVLVHEIGHALGLGHSKRQQAIMNPEYKRTPLEQLHLDIDDQCAINWNYVGLSDKCVFVWLMVEIFPNIETQKNGSKVAAGNPTPSSGITGMPPDPYKTMNSVGMMSVDQRIDQVFQTIELDKLEQCLSADGRGSDLDFVKAGYHRILMQKLDCTASEADHYAALICNFVSGLRRVVETKRNQQNEVQDSSEAPLFLNYKSTNTRTSPESWRQIASPLSQFSVHSYHKKFYQLFRKNFQQPTINELSRQTIEFDESFFRSIFRTILMRRSEA